MTVEDLLYFGEAYDKMAAYRSEVNANREWSSGGSHGSTDPELLAS